MTAVEKAAENAWLKVMARIAMTVSLPVLMAVATLIWNDHESIATTSAQISSTSRQITSAQHDISNLQSWETDTNGTVGSIESRLTTVEVKQQAAADRGVQTQATLKDIQTTLVTLLQQTAAINATLKNRADP